MPVETKIHFIHKIESWLDRNDGIINRNNDGWCHLSFDVLATIRRKEGW